ncbi:MAG: radical SAM protein [Desulfobacterales bacterium]|nr:radical SAM protein [Desulfobacterales bacterium]
MLNSLRKALKKGIITGQYSLNSSLGELRFAMKRSSGHVLPYLKNRFIWYFAPGLNVVTEFPTHVDIEISSLCQLNCPMCYTTTDYYKERVKKGLLDYDLYKKIIDECKKYSLYSVRFSWRGEPLMHPRFTDMLEYAKKAGIKEVSFLTNGAGLSPEIIDALIINRLDWLTVSFDGLYDMYEEYRKPLKFEDTVAKLKRLQRRKKELGINKPVLKVQTVWSAIENDPDAYFHYMSQTADEIAFNPLKDKRYYKEFDPESYDKEFVCPRLWQRIYVSSSGNIGFCLGDVYEDHIIGNIKDMSLYDAWNGEEFRKIRQQHTNHNRFEYTICRRCQDGLKRQKTFVAVEGRNVEATRYEFN